LQAVRDLQCSVLQMNSRTDGFTLLELMIVITIMGSMAALLAPGLGEFLADARASSAAEDLVRLSRHVRARTQESGLAHLLVFSATSNDSRGLGLITVYEGMNNHCRQTPWAQAINGTVADGHAPVESLDMRKGSYNPAATGVIPSSDDQNRPVIILSVTGSVSAPTGAVLCFEPGGRTLEGVGDASLGGFAFTTQTTAISFYVKRTSNGEQHGATREVVFPAGGSARFRF
jgi:prepilin-type N-terminal cleavage/methylation domain-containing protein